MFKLFRALVAFLPRLWSNWITLLGTVITSAAAITVLVALAIEFLSTGLNTYAAAVLFLVMPGLLALGLLLIPLGLYHERRRAQRPGFAAEHDQLQDALRQAMSSEVVRKRVAFVLLMTVLNVMIFSVVTHRAISFMETPQFCGNVCHSVMQPELDTYNSSPHSRVACVQCHVGEGATSAIKAKLAGLRQLWGIATGTFHRPIETPVHSLRRASETCEGCHQPGKFFGTRLDFRTHFKADKDNTPQVTAMIFPVGGVDPVTSKDSGIHAHISDRYQLRYESLDDKRTIIGKVQRIENGKVVAEWLPPKENMGKPVTESRIMDCVDCHNRVAHIYDGAPEAAVEKALASGRLDRSLPWIKQVAVGVLKAESPPRAEAERQFRRALGQAYERDHANAVPSSEKLDQAARGLAALYRRNVYPEMRLAWNNYPSNIGHNGPDPGNFKGQCFRCHDGEHATADGKVIPSKCELCHDVMAKDEVPKDLPDEIRPFLHL